MKKEEIIKLTSEMGFKLDYDQSDNKQWMRFISNSDDLDEKDLRWIWWIDQLDAFNINNGKVLQKRLEKKCKIQQFLKY